MAWSARQKTSELGSKLTRGTGTPYRHPFHRVAQGRLAPQPVRNRTFLRHNLGSNKLTSDMHEAARLHDAGERAALHHLG